ncbi:cupin domain-containing protein [Pontibacter rugosus]|uniref:Cupin domain-containing protein n=1 Tax=Pontibacter rugosus TaxID=1745966 RepID=A0ABW3SR75_9BACT
MNPKLTEFIESGVLELYIMGATTAQETLAVEKMAASHPEIRQEIDAISQAMESYALAHAEQPRKSVKSLVLATIDYMERMKQGELPVAPPVLTAESVVEDFAVWLNREDMVMPDDTEGVYAKIIGYTPAATTAVVWVLEMTENEVHHDDYERFLILEGSCNMFVGEEVHELKPGDFIAIPLHTPHRADVTSAIPCKVILQRLSIN